MNNPNELHPVEALLLIALVVVWAVRELLLHAAALVALLLTVAPASAAQAPAAAASAPLRSLAAPAAAPGTRTAPAPLNRSDEPASPIQVMTPAPMPELHALPVRELRRLARELQLPRCLSSSGRRDDLLVALPMAW